MKAMALAAMILAGTAFACGPDSTTSSGSRRHPRGIYPYRCVIQNPDGSCESIPANCPVSIPHDQTPRCEPGSTLILTSQDHCAHKLICID